MNEMYHITADKQKRKYGYVSNLIYYFKQMKAWNKWLFFCPFLQMLPQTLAYLLRDLLPATLVQGLEQGGSVLQILNPLFLIALGMLLMNVMSSAISSYFNFR